MVVTMKRLMHWMFFPILLITLAVSGYATYEVLAQTVGINTYIALGAAAVIDLAAIWLGLHATILAKLGDSTKLVQWATRFVIAISIAVNFYHGYQAGGYTGGLVGIIFPVLAALLFHFYISHTIRETLREQGLIIPRKPVYLKSRRYGDKTRQNAIQRDYVALTYDMAEDNLRQQRDKLKTGATKPLHVSQPVAVSETKPLQVVAPERDSVTTVARQIDEIVADIETPETLVALPDYLSPGMNTSQICRLLVEHDIRDIDVAHEYVNALNEDSVSRNTVRQGMLRATKKLEDATK
jgi:hypothetical protein